MLRDVGSRLVRASLWGPLLVLVALRVPALELRADEPLTADLPVAGGDSAEDSYQVPEGQDPATIQAFLRSLMQMPAPERTPAGLRDHFKKLEGVADVLFARPLDDGTAQLVIRLKMGALGILEQLGDPQAAQARDAFLVSLKNHTRPELARQGQLLDAETLIGRLQPGQREAARETVNRVAELLRTGPIEDSHVSLALGTSQALETLGDDQLAISANRLFAKYLRASDSESAAAIADLLEGTARRLDLPGNPVKIQGTTLEGQDFEISQWLGRVVLIDFWATWCGPCIAEMPHLKALYEAHHEQGLEIVGISLDENGRRLRSFVGLHELPWPILFDDVAAERGEENPIATAYGITGVPTMFLVGRDGKVAAVNLYGSALDEKIETLLKDSAGVPAKAAAE